MSIQKKNGKYVPVIYMGKDPLTQKKTYKWGSYWDKKREAELEHAEMLLKKDEIKKTMDYKDTTFQYLSDQWFELISAQKYSATTRDAQRQTLAKHINPVFGDKKIKDIQTLHIQRFLVTKKHLSAETQRKMYYLTNMIFESAVKWDMLSSNPCKGVELVKIKKKEKVTWTAEQVKTFLNWDNFRESKYYVMLTLSFISGMRPGEVCGLKWSNLKEDHLIVEEGLDKKKRETNLKNRPSHRKVYVSKELVRLLKTQSTWQKQNQILFGSVYKKSEYVFTHENGSLISPPQLRKAFIKLVARLNKELEESLPQITIYNARHSYGTNAIEAGAEPSALSRTMGHANTRTTFDNYVHTRDTAQQKVSTLMSEIYRKD